MGVLEIAQAFAEAKSRFWPPPQHRLYDRFREEKGLWGSAYYANNPVFSLENTVADLNIDMIGRIGSEYQTDKDSANYVYIIGDDKLSSALRPISETANNTYTKIKLDYKYNDPKDPNRFYYRSDHYNFAEKGVPIIFTSMAPTPTTTALRIPRQDPLPTYGQTRPTGVRHRLGDRQPE